MARLLGDRPGGILGLLGLADEYAEALESDLIDRELRLRDAGTEAFTWRDLKVVVKNLPTTSALVRQLNPDALWGLPEQLLAEAVDTLHWLQWAKTKGAAQKPPSGMPDQIPRPGVTPRQHGEVIKFDVMSQDEALEWLGWNANREVN